MESSEIIISDYQKRFNNSTPLTYVEMHEMKKSILEVLYCFIEERDMLAFRSSGNSNIRNNELLLKTRITGFPFRDNKRRAQRWYKADNEEEMLSIVGFGWDFTCAVIRETTYCKLRYIIKGREGVVGPNFLLILIKSGSDFMNKVVPRLEKIKGQNVEIIHRKYLNKIKF